MVRKIKKVKIAVTTSTRADYFLLRPLLLELKNQKWCTYGLLVTGTHLSKKYGRTIKDIQKDKFPIFKKINLGLKNDTPAGISHSFALGVENFSNFFSANKPDVLVIFGDRFEVLAATCAAHFFNIPIAHIGGGDVTAGAIDDANRHSITKMSHIHFPSNIESARRIVQLGERQDSVYNVGSLALDSIRQTKIFTKMELEKYLGFSLLEKNILITLHPETLSIISVENQIDALLTALSAKKFKNYRLLFTGTNADTQGSIIRKKIEKFIAFHDQAKFIESLGHARYFSALSHFDLVLGNSSSGVLEAPFLHTPTVNIGDRQLGRRVFSTIINTPFESKKIALAIDKAILRKKGMQKCSISKFYGDGTAAKKIVLVLKKKCLSKGLIKKEFYNIK